METSLTRIYSDLDLVSAFSRPYLKNLLTIAAFFVTEIFSKFFFFTYFFFIFIYFLFLLILLKKGYPPPLRNMLHMNGSNLAAATPDGIQSPQASSSNPVGSSLSQKKTCPYCGQQLSWHALSRHIRDMHKAKSNFVTCKFCNKMFRNKNSLGCHMWRFHKEAKEGAKDANIKAEPKIDNDIKPSSVEVENP